MEDQKPEEEVKENQPVVKTEPVISDAPKTEKKSSFWKKYNKTVVILSVAILALILFVLLNASHQTKVGKAPPPDPENVLLATVGDKQIYRNDAKAVALEQ